jgi:hypothetical protein
MTAAHSAQYYRDGASAMRQEAEWAESYDLKTTYMGMADEWDAMAVKAERVDETSASKAGLIQFLA